MVRRHEAPLVGLSALMTTTLGSMEKTITLLHEEGLSSRALLAPADALALDEPFTGLDTENRQRAAACIAQAAERMPVLLVTHDPLDLSTLRARCIKL